MIELASQVQDLLGFLAAPTPAPTPAPESGDIIDTKAILSWLAQVIAPILLAYLGVVYLSRARGGQVSGVLTSSGIALVGLVFIGGAGVLVLIGDDIINLVIR